MGVDRRNAVIMGDVSMKLAVRVLVVVGGLGLVYHLNTNFPTVEPAPDIQVAGTPEQFARGRYLANHVTVCIDCHSTRDWEHFAAPPVPGTEGKGGEVFREEVGFPGTLVAPNITPAAVCQYYTRGGDGDWALAKTIFHRPFQAICWRKGNTDPTAG